MSTITSTAVPEPHPVRLVGADDPRRTRLTVALRLVLAIPHLVLLLAWTVATFPAAVLTWAATLVAGRPPRALARFLGAYVRYVTRVGAYLTILADPYPPFGARGSYPLDVELDPPAEQRRLGVAFRLALAIPALVITNALQGVLQVVAILGWFYALATGRMHPGLESVGVYCLRYQAETLAYAMLLTSRYPSLTGIS